METFLCDRCCKMFYAVAGPTSCIYCQHPYVVWVTYPERTPQEILDILKRAEGDVNG